MYQITNIDKELATTKFYCELLEKNGFKIGDEFKVRDIKIRERVFDASYNYCWLDKKINLPDWLKEYEVETPEYCSKFRWVALRKPYTNFGGIAMSLVRRGILEVVGSEKIWVETFEDKAIRKEINIYKWVAPFETYKRNITTVLANILNSY